MLTVQPDAGPHVLSRIARTAVVGDVAPGPLEGRPRCEAVAAAHVLVPATPRGPWVAREFVRSRLCPVHAADLDVEVSMLVSELAKEAIRDGSAPVTVSVECRGSAVAVGVTACEAAPGADSDSASRRLTTLLLARLTIGWGIEELAGSRLLWGLVQTTSA